MVTVLDDCTTEEQRSVVRFVWTKELGANKMFPVYCGKCLSRKAARSWVTDV
jgi:hypothetical protein